MKMNINGAQSGPELCLFANYLPPPQSATNLLTSVNSFLGLSYARDRN